MDDEIKKKITRSTRFQRFMLNTTVSNKVELAHAHTDWFILHLAYTTFWPDNTKDLLRGCLTMANMLGCTERTTFQEQVEGAKHTRNYWHDYLTVMQKYYGLKRKKTPRKKTPVSASKCMDAAGSRVLSQAQPNKVHRENHQGDG